MGSVRDSWRFTRAFSPGKSALVVDDFSRILHRPGASAIVLAHPDHFEPMGILAARVLTDHAATAWCNGASMDDVFDLVPRPSKYSHTSLLVVVITETADGCQLHGRTLDPLHAWITEEAELLESRVIDGATDRIWRAPPCTRLVGGTHAIEWASKHAELPALVVSAHYEPRAVLMGRFSPASRASHRE